MAKRVHREPSRSLGSLLLESLPEASCPPSWLLSARASRVLTGRQAPCAGPRVPSPCEAGTATHPRAQAETEAEARLEPRCQTQILNWARTTPGPPSSARIMWGHWSPPSKKTPTPMLTPPSPVSSGQGRPPLRPLCQRQPVPLSPGQAWQLGEAQGSDLRPVTCLG